MLLHRTLCSLLEVSELLRSSNVCRALLICQVLMTCTHHTFAGSQAEGMLLDRADEAQSAEHRMRSTASAPSGHALSAVKRHCVRNSAGRPSLCCFAPSRSACRHTSSALAAATPPSPCKGDIAGSAQSRLLTSSTLAPTQWYETPSTGTGPTLQQSRPAGWTTPYILAARSCVHS